MFPSCKCIWSISTYRNFNEYSFFISVLRIGDEGGEFQQIIQSSFFIAIVRFLCFNNYVIISCATFMNNDNQAPNRAGYELTDGCSKFSTENLSDTPKFFLSGLKTTKGIERNLFAKRFLSNIFYSPESIKIRFISRQSEGVALAKRSPAPPLAGLGERTLSSSKSEFVSNLLAPPAGFEPATYSLTASCSTVELQRNSWANARWYCTFGTRYCNRDNAN